jgi:hypothetical protein
MINEQDIEKLTNLLVSRIQQANTYFLKKIGGNIKLFRTLTPSEAQQLVQILKYNGNYEEIVREISRLTNLNIQDIDEIFKQFAIKDQYFAKKFYKYKGVEFTPYESNLALQSKVNALATITKQSMYNLSNTRAIGYSFKDELGNVVFSGLKETYNRVLDEAVLNVGTGVDSFDSAMARVMKELGGSGLKTVDFASGYSRRLDSQVRMNLQGALRNLHNELQQDFGKEFGSDGIEISVHNNPAEDHELAQGRQFSNEEYKKLQEEGIAKDYTGKTIDLHLENKDGSSRVDFRPISEYNCYHYVFSIVLGVSKPNYDEKQLQQIIDDNNEGFEYEGKHYSNYQGTQIQRKLESQIREQKDLQIMAKKSGNEELLQESQKSINYLTDKYNEFCKTSGLQRKVDRLRVANYRKVAIKKD